MSHPRTLWQLLKDRETVICVPMIQRDYAQGRRGKEHIRTAFLKDIKECLLGGSELTLDFVYGNTEKEKFFPLDGQQRLTTLWLVHWYLAFRLGKLKEDEIRKALKGFSYQTRSSSEDFCERLCEEMGKADPGIGNVAEYIKKQTWFFTEWMQDPTVNAMLRTLGGETAKKDSGKENKRPKDSKPDHIEAVFGKLNPGEPKRCWENLTENGKITFRLMIIGSEQLPISDDLYIKMNARGKKLTEFENFKADWISHIQNLGAMSSGEPCSQHYPKIIDNQWTDVFWNSTKGIPNFKGKIDGIFFAFINRFVFNQLCLDQRFSSSESKEDDFTRRAQKHFDLLYGRNSSDNDSLIEYTGFEAYEDYLTKETMESLELIFASLTHPAALERVNDLSFSHGSDGSYLIPKCDAEGVFRGISQVERVRFHAVCLFLEQPNWEQWDNWKRVVRNLTENATIDNVAYMISCLRAVHELGTQLRERQWKIVDSLPTCTLGDHAYPALAAQWEEEKSRLPCSNRQVTKGGRTL